MVMTTRSSVKVNEAKDREPSWWLALAMRDGEDFLDHRRGVAVGTIQSQTLRLGREVRFQVGVERFLTV